jgi:dCMP deaminase
MFMGIAEVVARRSTCARLAVGAVIVVGNRVVSVGYNGPEAGEPHCSPECAAAAVGGCTRAIHAEINAMRRVPTSDRDAPKIMYVTDSPCIKCCGKLAYPSFNLCALYYMHPFREIDHLGLIRRIYRMTPSGYVIDHKTGAVVDAKT